MIAIFVFFSLRYFERRLLMQRSAKKHIQTAPETTDRDYYQGRDQHKGAHFTSEWKEFTQRDLMDLTKWIDNNLRQSSFYHTRSASRTHIVLGGKFYSQNIFFQGLLEQLFSQSRTHYILFEKSIVLKIFNFIGHIVWRKGTCICSQWLSEANIQVLCFFFWQRKYILNTRRFGGNILGSCS